MSSDDFTEVAPITPDEHPTDTGHRPAPPPGALMGGRYAVTRRIGKGGMGEVMAANDKQVGREVAIKRMRAAAPSERSVARFVREASIQGRLEHPAIVPVHEIGNDSDGLPYFVMKKLAGTNLAEMLKTGGYSRQAVLRAFVEVCLAVEFAHINGVVHRDLKPENIVLGDFGEVYVIDWGVAKVIGETDDNEMFADIGSGSGEHATKVGTTIGTPGYMAPEQARGLDIDGRVDVYTLGCLLFEILSGEPLHPRGIEGIHSAVAGRDARASVRAPGNDVPPELDAVCVAATAIDRDSRIRSARELGNRVQRYLDGDRDVETRRELARVHFERAKAAFGSGDAHRRDAMREAAAAIALDPGLDGAAELVGRLMLEPPVTTPKEVDDAVAADDDRSAREMIRHGIKAVIASALFIPLVWWMAPSWTYVAGYAGILALLGVIGWYGSTSERPKPGWVVLGNTLLLVIIARMFSPLLIAPGLAAVLGLSMVLAPRMTWLTSPASVASLSIVGMLTPLILELAGAISSTMSVDKDGILFMAPAVSGNPLPTYLTGTVYAVGLVIAACLMADVTRARTRAAYQHLHLQAWQLRQLVPR